MIGRSLMLVPAALLLLAAGGQAAPLDPPGSASGPGEVGRFELSLPAQVEKRLDVYGEKQAHWRELGARTAGPDLAARRPPEWAGCAAAVENLARNYGRLQEELARASNASGPEVVSWQVVFDDIAFLEGGCGLVYQQAAGLAGGGESRGVTQAPPESADQPAPLGEQEQQEKWQRAVALADAGDYDQAIGEFSGLLRTPYAAAAREKIREAQTVVATQLRRQAAGILARKTDDPAQKKKLLMEAWALLNKIISSYPEAAIIDKVKQNQAQIEGQLDRLDPALLPRLKGAPPPG